jgi:demethylmenaquinone methyltransferase/2-methoxy-6-polyprenyl-1,4-benzoquinol methylase
MGNEFLDEGPGRAARVMELFARIAPRYDLINDLQSFGLHRFWKTRVVKLASVQPGDHALDVCCGTGDLALALADRGAEVVGLDFTENMLTMATARKRPEKKRRRLTFVRADAQRIPFPSNSFNVVTVGYGLRNLANWERGLGEMLRVAKPGGRIVVLEFGKPGNVIWRGPYLCYLRLFVPILGKVFCGSRDAYGYILESLKIYPGQEAVSQKMREIGLKQVRTINLLGGIMSINYGEKHS